MTFNIINQTMVIIFCLFIIYYSFRALNLCDKNTEFIIRYSKILSFTGAVAILIQTSMNVIPHWSFTMILIAYTLLLYRDRRRANFKIGMNIKS